jgi:hypothetical protein
MNKRTVTRAKPPDISASPPISAAIGTARATAVVSGLMAGERAHPESDPSLATALGFLELVLSVPEPFPPVRPFTPAPCQNCDGPPLEPKKTFCSELCKQESGFVRYVRRKISSGTLIDVDVLRDGIGTALLMIQSGGYPTRERTVSAERRAFIIDRDRGRCRRCGAPGTDIDHIAGSSDAEENLQLLCGDCNTKKMGESTRVLDPTADRDLIAAIRAQATRLAYRVASATPLRVCDDEVAWPSAWRAIQAACRAART